VIDYAQFIASKTQAGADSGFEPLWMPDFLFPFQAVKTEWAIRKGRAPRKREKAIPPCQYVNIVDAYHSTSSR